MGIAWRNQSKQDKSTKCIVSFLDNHWRHQDLKYALSKWASFSKARKRMKNIDKKIRSKHEKNEMNEYLAEWRYCSMITNKIKSAQQIKKSELIKNAFVLWKVYGHREKALRAKTTFIRMELRAMPETKQLLQDKLGNLWKHVRSPIFRQFLSWKLSVQQTKQMQRSYQIAKSHHEKTVYIQCFKKMSLALYDVMLSKRS